MTTRRTILIVEDDKGMLESYKLLLESRYNVFLACNANEAFECLRKEAVDLVLLDIVMPGVNGLNALKTIKELCDVEVIMVTADQTVRTAIQAVKLGAYDFISKPFDVDALVCAINKALEKVALSRQIMYLKSELKPKAFENIIGSSKKLEQVLNLISEVAQNQSTVLITGESGTGKELVARAIHRSGPNRDNPFVAVDCATIPENLVESELFGHEKGAFTDATSQKIGKFELSNGGTLFLDEIGNLQEEIQCKILRVMEEREIQRVGGTKTIKIDTRVISATNIDIKKAIKEKKFREDLFYRLNVIPINVPPLRERKEDIPVLVEHFVAVYNREFGKNIRGLTKDALSLMVNYDWPGNIRELKNVIERLVALNKEGAISHKGLPIDIILSEEEKPQDYYDKLSLREARDEFEKKFILKTLEKVNWNQSKAAQLLGIHRNALLYKINLFELRAIMNKSRAKERDSSSDGSPLNA